MFQINENLKKKWKKKTREIFCTKTQKHKKKNNFWMVIIIF